MKTFIKYDPNKNRNLRFQIVASFILILVICSFKSNWEVSEIAKTDLKEATSLNHVPIMEILPPLPKPKTKVKEVKIDSKTINHLLNTDIKLVDKKKKKPITKDINLAWIDIPNISRIDNFKIEKLTMPDREANFPGGLEAATNFLESILEYPEEAMYTYEECVVTIKVYLDEYGNIYDYKIVNISEPGYGFDEKAIEALKKMPKWEPAVLHNRYVKSTVIFPFVFEID